MLTSSTPGGNYLSFVSQTSATGLGTGTSSGQRPTVGSTGRLAMFERSRVPQVGALVTLTLTLTVRGVPVDSP